MFGYFIFATPGGGAHVGAPHVVTHNQITSQLAPTTLPILRAPPNLTFASRTPRNNARTPTTAHVPHVPPCRVPPAPLDVRTRHHQTIRTTPMHAPPRNGANKLRYMCRLPFTLRPPALSTCPHLCHSNIEPPLASCCQTRPARSCTVTHRSSGVHAPLRTGARTRRARPIRIRNAERRVPSCLRNA
jgi:hypothetical protein